MKKTIKMILAIGLCLMLTTAIGLAFVGCDLFSGDSSEGDSASSSGISLVNYSATTRFIYSTDGGATWSETIQEVPVGKPYWLGVEVQVKRGGGMLREEEVGVEITIPSTDVSDAYLDDHPGTSVTGITNLDGSKTYSFTILANNSPAVYRTIFECIPLQAGRATIYVTYDDKLTTSYDRTGVIKYVEE